MNKILCLLIVMLFVGCTTTKKYKFPDNIKDRSHAQKAAAYDCITKKGTKLDEKKLKYVMIYVVKGEKKFKYGWGWRSPEWNGMWVLGLCSGKNGGYIVKVASDPNNSADVSDVALKHEFGHYWMMLNYNDGSHNKMYSSCFLNWNEPNVKTLMVSTNGENIVVDYITDEEAELLEVVE